MASIGVEEIHTLDHLKTHDNTLAREWKPFGKLLIHLIDRNVNKRGITGLSNITRSNLLALMFPKSKILHDFHFSA